MTEIQIIIFMERRRTGVFREVLSAFPNRRNFGMLFVINVCINKDFHTFYFFAPARGCGLKFGGRMRTSCFYRRPRMGRGLKFVLDSGPGARRGRPLHRGVG